jgi:hypothetical protein
MLFALDSLCAGMTCSMLLIDRSRGPKELLGELHMLLLEL